MSERRLFPIALGSLWILKRFDRHKRMFKGFRIGLDRGKSNGTAAGLVGNMSVTVGQTLHSWQPVAVFIAIPKQCATTSLIRLLARWRSDCFVVSCKITRFISTYKVVQCLYRIAQNPLLMIFAESWFAYTFRVTCLSRKSVRQPLLDVKFTDYSERSLS
jgi:hypothetical protein